MTMRIWPLNTPAMFSAAIPLLSTRASIPRKTSRPAVRLRKNLYALLPTLLINGNHRRPISTGIMPTYVPTSAKNDACSILGAGAGAAAVTPLLNLVPSDVVMPISYGSPALQGKGMITLASASLGNSLLGSIAAGCILSLTSACATVTSIGPVFRTSATIWPS